VVELHGTPLDLYPGKAADPRYNTQSERIKRGIYTILHLKLKFSCNPASHNYSSVQEMKERY